MKLIAAVLVAIIVCMLPGAAQAQCSGQFAPGTLCGNATGSLAPPRSVAAGAFGFITVTVVQGDLVYGSASGVLSALPKDTNATRYLSNTGTSNNPAWAQVSLTSGVTGNLPLANIAQSAANTMLGNWTGSTANVAANAMISCPDTGGNHLNYVSGTGITCGTSGGASGITTLTGDVTASGSGSVVATLATVASAGTTGSSTAIPVITINAKGLTTSITTAAVVAPAGTLTGATLAANVLASSLTSVGTLTGGATGSGFTINLGTSTVSGNLATANLAGGSGASSSTFWRGDGTWATPAGSGNVTTSVTLTANRLVLGNGTTDLVVLASLGTTATLLHGNAAGAPTFGSVVSADLNITPTTCTNQFVTAISAAAAGTCTTATLASAQFANQGTTITVLHGNAAGNPAFSSVVSADLNLTTTSCSAGTFVTAIAATGIGTCSGFSGALTITATSTNALAVGRLGATTPAWQVDTTTGGTTITGVKLTAGATTAGVDLTAIGETNVAMRINAAGSGTVTIGGTSTGNVVLAGGGGQTVVNGAAGSVALRFVNDNLTGLGSRAALELNAYANSTEVMRWAQTNITAFSTLTAASTLVSNVTRTIASANLQAGTSSWADVNTQASTTTISGSTNISSFVLAKNQFEVPVLTASAAAIAITSAMNVYIAGAPTTSSSGGFTPTITNPYALYVASGLSFFGGGVSTNNTNNGYGLFVSHAPTTTSAATVTWQSFAVSSTLTLTGTTTVSNDTAMVVFGQPLITDASAVTVSKASTVYIAGAPVGGGSATVTAAGAFALKIAAGNVSYPASGYINFGNTSGTTGYGFRDNSGTMQFSNSGGSWTNFGGSSGLTIGTTTITSGTTGRLLWDNAAVLGESTNIYTDGTVFNMGSSTNFAFGLTTATWQLNGIASGTVQAGIGGYSSSSGGTINNAGQFAFYRSRSGTIGTATVVAQDDALGTIRWFGAQQTGTIATQTVAASIRAEVDGVVTSGAGADMPGRVIIATTPDGSGTVTDSLKIDNAGNWFMLLAGSTDSGKTTNTVCRDTTTGQLYRGSGTAGICVGTSSARFKHDVTPLQGGLAEVVALQSISFRYNRGYGDDGDRLQYGFTAEQMAPVLPTLVGRDGAGRPNTVDILGLTPIVVRAIQELKADNDNLRAANDNLERRLARLEGRR
jgi:hypothetical protein